jgi:glycerate kinase
VAMFDGGRAVIEMAESAGHVEEGARDLMAAGTVGVGYAIHAALDLGARHVTIAAGGTGTVDGGIGALRALGARLLAADGSELEGTAAGLLRLAEIDASGLDPRLRGSVRIAADVFAPLCGRHGAARGFAPQKGADPGQVEELEAGLGRLAGILGVDPATPGLGAAGGFPAAFTALAGAEVVSGAEWVRESVGFGAALSGARLCITGEGRVDRQTALGKTVAGVIEAGRTAGVPVVVFGGTVEPEGAEALYELGAAGVFGLLVHPSSLAEAQLNVQRDLDAFGRSIGRFFAHSWG